MAAINLDFAKNLATNITDEVVNALNFIQSLHLFQSLRTNISQTVYSISQHDFFISYGITPSHIIAISFILAGLSFIIFGKTLLKLLAFINSFTIGFTIVLLLSAIFKVELDSGDDLKVLILLGVALLGGVVMATWMMSFFSKSISIFITLGMSFVSFWMARSMASAFVTSFYGDDKKVSLIYLTIQSTKNGTIPFLGLIAFHVFVLLILTALYSIHFVLPILAINAYLLEMYLYIPFEKYELGRNVAEVAKRNLGKVDVPLETVLFGALFAFLLIEIVVIMLRIRLETIISVVVATVGALLVGIGTEKLFSEVNYELYQKLVIYDKGMGIKVSTISIITTIICVLVGTAVQMTE